MGTARVKSAGISRHSPGKCHLVETDESKQEDARNIFNPKRKITQTRICIQLRLSFYQTLSSFVSDSNSDRRRSEFSASWTWQKDDSGKGFRAMNRMSQPTGIEARSGCKAFRIKRFARLRWTAFPTVFPATTPIRKVCNSFGKTIITRSGWRTTFPDRRSRWKLEEPCKRNLRFNLKCQTMVFLHSQATYLK